MLAEQGSLCAEAHGQGRAYYRLRFPYGDKATHSLRRESQGFVDQVRTELTLLQARTHSRRELRRLADEARRIAKNTKCLLEPLLPSAGRVFHGLRFGAGG